MKKLIIPPNKSIMTNLPGEKIKMPLI
jgi:hypothetical protein